MISLREGLRSNELDYLVLPLISIDEYKSKIDDRKAVVVGFYVTDADPAHDLAAFIEKGPASILDIDVSPAPTTDGYYLVFAEIERNDKFPKTLMSIVDELGNITNVEDWQFSPYGSKEKDNYDLTADAIKEHINLDPDSVEVDEPEDEDTDDGKDAAQESVAGFFGDALFETMTISGDLITINDRGCYHRYHILEGSENEPNVPIIIPGIADQSLADTRKLQQILGNGYEVYPTNEGLLVASTRGYVMLKSVD